jgi:hypothetical protein
MNLSDEMNQNVTKTYLTKFLRMTNQLTDDYMELVEELKRIISNDDLLERIHTRTDIAMDQVQRKYGAMLKRAEVISEGQATRLYKASALLNANAFREKNKPRNKQNLTLSVRSAKHMMHTLQLSDQEFEFIGKDAYTIPIAMMQIYAIANQHGSDFLNLKEVLNTRELTPAQRYDTGSGKSIFATLSR